MVKRLSARKASAKISSGGGTSTGTGSAARFKNSRSVVRSGRSSRTRSRDAKKNADQAGEGAATAATATTPAAATVRRRMSPRRAATKRTTTITDTTTTRKKIAKVAEKKNPSPVKRPSPVKKPASRKRGRQGKIASIETSTSSTIAVTKKPRARRKKEVEEEEVKEPEESLTSIMGMNEDEVNDEGIETKDKSESSDEESLEEEDQVELRKVYASEMPFHVDVSAQKAFYTSLDIEPPMEQYANCGGKLTSSPSNKDTNSTKINFWKVKLGDTVAIHVDLDRNARNRNPVRARKGGTLKDDFYPFTVQWWIADIIAIYKTVTTSEGQKLRSQILDGSSINTSTSVSTSTLEAINVSGDYKVEVRWLYRHEDIPGMNSRSKTMNMNNGGEEIEMVEEVFETDDVGEYTANAILAPVEVHTAAISQDQLSPSSSSFLLDNNDGSGMKVSLPLAHCFCQRSWSVHRKTLLPIGSTQRSHRIQRGMLYSNYMGRSHAARAAFETISTRGNGPENEKGNESKKSTTNQSWKKIFKDSIRKLTLAEASAVDRGVQMIGREEQIQRIKHFLGTAIRVVNEKAKEEDISSRKKTRFSLFIGGPPGTGKTASVNYVLSQLKQEQAAGTMPEFSMVTLNGMENRRAFDIYARLWEAISPGKEKTSHDEAVARLEWLLAGEVTKATSRSKSKSKKALEIANSTKRRVIVLLVDEIDYLVTQKQSVLHNLFDWPIRGFKNKSRAQLIVIGISNTINLPDRLHERLQSRVGQDRCNFSAYSVKATITILEGKLGITDTNKKSIFSSEAIMFASRKISKESGDIRKVFSLAKTAAENVYGEIEAGERSLTQNGDNEDGSSTPTKVVNVIGIGDVQKAANQMFNSVTHQAVKTAAVFVVLLLISVASLRKSCGKERGAFDLEDILIKMHSVANAFGDKLYTHPWLPDFRDLCDMLPPLAESGIISLSTPNGANGYFGTNGASDTKVILNMEDYEILSALKDTQHKALADKHLTKETFAFGKI